MVFHEGLRAKPAVQSAFGQNDHGDFLALDA